MKIKYLKYFVCGVFILIIISVVLFYFFVVNSTQILIDDGIKVHRFYSYEKKCQIEKIDDKKIIKIFLNHQDFWSMSSWYNFPDAPVFSVIEIVLEDDELSNIKGRIYSSIEGSIGDLKKEFNLEGKLIVTDKYLKDVDLKSEQLGNFLIYYKIDRINLEN